MDELRDRVAFQLTTKRGFTFRGKQYEGFEDRIRLPFSVRAQVARWALKAGVATDLQRDLAKVAADEKFRDETLELLAQEQAFLGSDDFNTALSLLSPEQREHLLRPHNVLKRTFAWPLSIGDAARILETVTEHQLRDWDEHGLVVAQRWGDGRYRGYFRRDLMAAWMVESLLDQGWSITGLRQRLGLEPMPAQVEILGRVLSFNSSSEESVVDEPELTLQ